ncbi:MAG: MerR family transcriptional regulator [Streptosporangiales bacterium]|nr:MerR family transcriptional regulator [Streptosporangiales bacterium]
MTMTVGMAAQAAGLSAKAVRLYETKGLVPPVARNSAGYRTYTEDHITVLRFVRQAEARGLSLAEIRHILELRRGGTVPCRHVVQLLDERIDEVDRSIAELRQLRHALVGTRAAAERNPSDDTVGTCRIIELG